MQVHLRKLEWLIAAALIAISLPVSVQAQDPGIPDTVQIVSDGLVVGESRPISVRMVNDSVVSALLVPLRMIEGPAGGFAMIDSIVYRNRMADPNVFGFRNFNSLFSDGSSPDSIEFAGYRFLADNLPPGNDVIFDFYYTGLEVGTVVVDTVTHVPANYLLANSEAVAEYIPIFLSATIQVAEAGPQAPSFPALESPAAAAVGDMISFAVSAESPQGSPVSVSIRGIAACDDGAVTPATSPLGSGPNPLTVTWTPTAGDVGIWCVELEACDTLGLCQTAAVMVSVVSSPEALVTFSEGAIETTHDMLTLVPGDFISGGRPELFVSGSGVGADSTNDFLFAFDSDTIGSKLFSYFDGLGSRGPQLGYLDADDNLDVAVRRTDKVSSLLGDGAGGFSIIDASTGAVLGISAAILGEFTGDGYLDYIVLYQDEGFVFRGLAGGMFDAVSPLQFSLPENARSANKGDFNLDGALDLAVGTEWGMRVFLNNGAGTFTLAASYGQTFGTSDVQVTNASADFNNDGYHDLTLATPSVGGPRSELFVYLGNGDGTFAAHLVREVWGQIPATRTGDFNNDTHLDIAFINSARNYLGLLLGDGSGTFTDELRLPLTGGLPRTLAACDYDIDGDLDIVIFGKTTGSSWWDPSSLTVYTNQNDPSSTAASLRIDASGNAHLCVVTPEGFVVDRNRSTLSSGAYYGRSSGTGVTGERIELACLPGQSPTLRVAPRAGLPISATFGLAFTHNGRAFRLADGAVMAPGGYTFPIQVAGEEDILPVSGSFSHNRQPTFHWPVPGTYTFELAEDPGFTSIVHSGSVSGTEYTLPSALPVSDTSLFYWRVVTEDKFAPAEIYAVNIIAGGQTTAGDVSGDGQLNLTDITLIVTWLFAGGPEPPNPGAGDVNNSGAVSLTDITQLVNYLFFGGTLP